MRCIIELPKIYPIVKSSKDLPDNIHIKTIPRNKILNRISKRFKAVNFESDGKNKLLLDLKNIKFLNIHASLLPKWRGAAPIQRSIMNMDKETGISIMKILPKLDSGPVLMQGRIKISEDTSYLELSKKMSEIGAKLILNSIILIEDKKEKTTWKVK